MTIVTRNQTRAIQQQGDWRPLPHLPPEVLASIFMELRNDYLQWRTRNSGIRKWIPVSHTCKEWRSAALDCAQFWTFIRVEPEAYQWITVCLQRSRTAPIDVCIELGEPGHLRCKEPQQRYDATVALIRDTLPNHMWRCASLEADYALSGDTLRQLLSAKLLQQLNRICLDTDNLVVNDDLIRASSLRRLEVSGALVGWGASVLQGLTHLDITSVKDKIDNPLGASLQDVLHGLSEMPFLRHLHILAEYSDLSSTLYFAKLDTKIRLRHLEHFEMDAGMDMMAGLISNILVPPSCSIVLRSFLNHNDLEFCQICAALSTCRLPASCLDNEGINVARSALLDFGDAARHYNLDLQVYEDVHGSERESGDINKPVLDLSFWHEKYTTPSVYTERYSLASLLSCVDFGHLSVLHLSGSDHQDSWNIRIWLELFGSNEALHTLYTEYVHPEPLFQALGRETDGSEGSSTLHNPTFPNLKKIVFKFEQSEGFFAIRISEDLISMMCRSLAKRKKSGFAIEELELSNEFRKGRSKFAKVVGKFSFITT